MDWWQDAWAQVTTPNPEPSALLVGGTALLVVVVLAFPTTWRAARHALTIVHEAGHAAVAVFVGRRVSGIKVHSDTSGLTLSRGKPRGPGMVATAFAGYPAPALVGLGAAWLLGSGYDVAVLWALLVVAVLVLAAIRNWYGLWAVLVSLAVLVAVTGWGSAAVQSAFAYAVTWLFLLGAPRAVVELQAERRHTRRAGRRDSSDAGLLAGLTHVAGAVWVVVFALVTLAAAVWGGAWLAGLR